MKKYLVFPKLFLLTSMVMAQNLKTDSITNTIAQGSKYLNISFSLDQRKAENENQLLRDVVNQDKLNYDITLSSGYAIKESFTLGLGFSYGRQREDVVFVNEENQEITNKSIGQDFSIIPNMRKYIPLGKGTFQIFVQTNLRFTYGESLQRSFLVNEIEKIETDFFELRFGVQPGAIIFFDKNFGFETSVGLVGLSSKWSSKTVNGDVENQTKITENNINLDLNLLSLQLGVAYYF